MTTKLYKGTLSNVILKLLSENDRMYGYQLSKEIKLQTDNNFNIAEGALYTALHKLELEGILDTEHELVDGRNRKYYKLTKEGESEALIKIQELQLFINSLTSFIQPKTI